MPADGIVGAGVSLGGLKLAPSLAVVFGIPVQPLPPQGYGNLVVVGVMEDLIDLIFLQTFDALPFLTRIGGPPDSARVGLGDDSCLGVIEEEQAAGLAVEGLLADGGPIGLCEGADGQQQWQPDGLVYYHDGMGSCGEV